jgi:DNA repair protein RadA/Sms
LARSVSTYVCQACGARTRQFFGRCASCGQWNTLVEQVEAPTDSRRRRLRVARRGRHGTARHERRGVPRVYQ